MTVNKRSKRSRARGTWTHGWGAKKKHRGAGHRGGRGMAGTGKKADAKKPSIWKEDYFGKSGFTSRKPKLDAINIKDLDKIITEKNIKEENGFYNINLDDFGYGKLLSLGNTNKKLRITVNSCSENAKKKIADHGGEVLTAEISEQG